MNFTVGALLVVAVVTVVVPPSDRVTMSVNGDVAFVVPNRFEAVISTLSSWPTSAERTPYVCPVAPEMSTQSFPPALHRCHWYENVVAPVHVPLSEDSVSPTSAAPSTVGRPVFFGAAAGATTPVPFESFVVLPSSFVAVTRTRSVWSTSAARTRYARFVAPAISAQLRRSPTGSQRSHWYEY